MIKVNCILAEYLCKWKNFNNLEFSATKTTKKREYFLDATGGHLEHNSIFVKSKITERNLWVFLVLFEKKF